MNRRKWLSRTARGLLATAGVWVLGDLLYAAAIRYRMRRWVRRTDWDDEGVQRGCQPFTLGQGRDAILLVHGFNNSPRLFQKMADRLARAGFTCRAMRLPGFSERPGQSTAGVDHWVAAIAEELATLRAAHRQVHVVAHSLGAAATLQLLVRQPGAADRIVLLAPMIDVSTRRSPLLHPRQWHQLGRRLLLFTTHTETPFANDVHDPAARGAADSCRFTSLRTLDEVFRLIALNRGVAGKIQTPALVVLSRTDRVVDWEAAERFYRDLPLGGGLVFTDTGHDIPLDRGWRTTTEAIAAWLGRTASRPAT